MGLSVSNLKRALSKKTKGELVKEITTLYQKFLQVEDYYQTQMSDSKDILNKYKTIIEKEFIEGKTKACQKQESPWAKRLSVILETYCI